MKFFVSFIVLLSLALLTSPAPVRAQDGKAAIPLYDAENPNFLLVWSRIADFHPRLRAVETVEFSPDGRQLVSGGKFGYAVMLWRVADGALLWENHHESEVECVVFSPDGTRIASGGEDNTVRIWDVETGEQITQLPHDTAVDGITWSHDGRLIVSGGEDGNAWFWDGESYELLGKVHVGDTINSLQFTTDDTRLAVAGNLQKNGKYFGFVKLIDPVKRVVVKTFGDKPFPGSKKSVRISLDDKLLAATGFDNTLHVFDMRTGEVTKEISFADRIEAVEWAPDGRMLLAAGKSGKIHFYNTRSWEEIYSIPAIDVEYLDFSPDGRMLATAYEDSGLITVHLHETQLAKPKHYRLLQNQQLDNHDLKPRR